MSTTDDSPLLRFDRAERLAHQATAVLMAVLLFTGVALYYQPLMSVIGRRDLVEQIHVWCGIALPLPIIVSALGYWGAGTRADAARLDRWSRDDRTWLRVSLAEASRRRYVRARLRLGKFNAGQKLNTVFTLGSILIMLGTGLIMRFYHPWPLAWRTGATFVHDWLTVAIVVVVLGHVRFALKDPAALRSIWRGTISRRWAATHAPVWLEELDGAGTAAAGDRTAVDDRAAVGSGEQDRDAAAAGESVGASRAAPSGPAGPLSGRRPPGAGGPGPSPAR
jgi:formate dehydrogenase subunit gamma